MLRLLSSPTWVGLRDRAPYRVVRLIEGLGLNTDLASLRRWTKLRPDGPERLVELHLRPLKGARFHVRSGTADVWALPDTYLPAAHLPPPTVGADSIRTIWDLGANIGASMAHLAVRYPQARVLGVELDAGNAAVCRTNIEPWSDRCELVNGAVWTRDGVVQYHRENVDALSFRIGEGSSDEGETTPAWSLNSLLERNGNGTMIDYVKMDIEGAEQHVLRENTEWAARVRAIKIEVHEPYTTDECVRDLRKLGFDADLDSAWHRPRGKPAVIGIRRDA